MVRKVLLRSGYYPYHVTGRSNNKEWFYVPLDVVWKIFCDQLTVVTYAYNAKIHAFVLMSNHYHLLISTPDANLGQIMNYLIREVSRAINQCSSRINHVFGGRYKACMMMHGDYYSHALRYVYRNPVRAKLCLRASDYKYSTLHGILGHNKLNVPLRAIHNEFCNNFPKELNDFERWVNENQNAHNNELLTNLALRKTLFSFPKRYKNKRLVIVDS